LNGVTIAVRISPSTPRFYETGGVIVLREFRDFVMRGNLVELAVAFVLGLAFAALVSSFVDDLILPIVAMIFGEPDFSSLDFTVNDAVFRYGAFLTALFTFLVTAAALFFFVVKPVNALMERVRKPDEEEEVTDEERRHRELLAAIERISR
jgi:large conductance mechanosensitive channel